MNCPNQIWHTANQKTSICKHPHPHHKIPFFVEPPLSSDLALSLASRISPFSSISWSLRLVTRGHLSQYYQMVFITYICLHCITTYQMNWDTDLRQDRFKKLGLCLGACNFPMGELHQSLEVWMCRRGGVLDRDMAPYSHVKKAVEWGDRRCNRANLSLSALGSACWMSSFHLNYGQRHLCKLYGMCSSHQLYGKKTSRAIFAITLIHSCKSWANNQCQTMPNTIPCTGRGGNKDNWERKTQHPALSSFWIADVSSTVAAWFCMFAAWLCLTLWLSTATLDEKNSCIINTAMSILFFNALSKTVQYHSEFWHEGQALAYSLHQNKQKST